MTTNLQQSPYIQLQRNFATDDLQSLGVTLDHTYIDIAQKINARTIGMYSTNLASITGESWFLTGQPNRQQTLRKVYVFTFNTAIAHGINFSQIDRFTSMYGSFTDGTNWYGLIAGSNTLIAGQRSFYLDPTNINFLGTTPTITKGTIVLEWLSQF